MEGGESATAGTSKEGAAATPAAQSAPSATQPAASPQFGAPTGDDGGRLAVGAQAKEAAFLFHAGRYTECLAILQQLLVKKEDDLKVSRAYHHSLPFCFLYNMQFPYPAIIFCRNIWDLRLCLA